MTCHKQHINDDIMTNCSLQQTLDDGWPESVEEQGLLLLVWRHYITKQYIKDVLWAVEKRSIKTI